MKSKKKNLILIAGALLLFTALLGAVALVQKTQETRRGAVEEIGEGKIQPVIRAYVFGTSQEAAILQPGQNYHLRFYLNSINEVFSARVVGAEISFDSAVFRIDSLACSNDFPRAVAREANSSGLIRLTCFRDASFSELLIPAEGAGVLFGIASVFVKEDAPSGATNLEFLRTNIPNGADPAVPDLAVEGKIISLNITSLEPTATPTQIPSEPTATLTPTLTPTQVPPSPTPTSVPDECTVTSMNAGDGEFENKIEITFIYTGCPGGHQVYLSRIPGGWSQDVPTAPSLTVPHHTTNIGLNCGKSYNYCAQAMDADDNLYGDQKCDDGNTLACLADPTATPTPTSGVGGPSCSIDVFKPGDNLYNDRIFINLSYSDCPGGEYLIEVNRLDSGWSKTILTHDWGNYTLSNSGLSCGEQYTYSAKAYFSEIVLGSPVFVANDITGSTAACLSPTPTITPVLPTATPTIAGPTNTPTLPPFECTCENQDAKLNYKAKGDGDCNGATDLLDYNAWFSAFIRGDQGYAAWADFNCKNGVTIDDYGIWRENAGF